MSEGFEAIENIFISDLKAHLREDYFLHIILLVIIILSLILILFWPTGVVAGFHRPLLGGFFANTLLISIFVVNLILLNQKNKFPRMLTIQEWVFNAYLSRSKVVLGKVFSLTLQGFLILFSTLPLGLMVFFAGGFSAYGLGLLYLLSALIAIAGNWIGLYLLESYPHKSLKTNITVVACYLLGTIVSSFFSPPYLRVNIPFQIGLFCFAGLLFLALVTNIMGLFFK